MEKALVTKKQQSMSNYRLSSSALELQCCCLSNHKMIAICASATLPHASMNVEELSRATAMPYHVAVWLTEAGEKA